MVCRHPLSSIQHPLEDPGTNMKLNIHFWDALGVCHANALITVPCNFIIPCDAEATLHVATGHRPCCQSFYVPFTSLEHFLWRPASGAVLLLLLFLVLAFFLGRCSAQAAAPTVWRVQWAMSNSYASCITSRYLPLASTLESGSCSFKTIGQWKSLH